MMLVQMVTIGNDTSDICRCPPGYVGRRCEWSAASDCRQNQCRNGGLCNHQLSSYNSKQSYQCACRDGFTGQQCEINVDECASNPCLNG